MKILITKSSDWLYEKIVECESLEKCIDTLIEQGEPKFVVSKVPDWYDWREEEATQCKYKVEIYDSYRE